MEATAQKAAGLAARTGFHNSWVLGAPCGEVIGPTICIQEREAPPAPGPPSPHVIAGHPRDLTDPVLLTQGSCRSADQTSGHAQSLCPLTIECLGWLPLSGGELCSSEGTTSNSEDVPCGEVRGCSREHAWPLWDPLGEQQGKGRTRAPTLQPEPAQPSLRALCTPV